MNGWAAFAEVKTKAPDGATVALVAMHRCHDYRRRFAATPQAIGNRWIDVFIEMEA
ncbi:MAG: hypothetical protein ABSH20_22590 [Tepidisphaeraceae bacterium]|jgi:hypothetical protein